MLTSNRVAPIVAFGATWRLFLIAIWRSDPIGHAKPEDVSVVYPMGYETDQFRDTHNSRRSPQVGYAEPHEEAQTLVTKLPRYP